MARCTSIVTTSTFLALAMALPAAGADITLTLANDALAPRGHVDDLYTADTQLAVHLGRYRLQLGERMFTDRDRDLRFDETTFEISRPLPRFGRWRVEVGLGALHVGRGLLGASTQNAVHRLIGNSVVDLEYAADHDLYGRARVDVWRPLVERAAVDLSLHASATLAPGLDSHARVGLHAERALPAGVSAFAGVATLAHRVETELLDTVIADRGMAWNLGVAWRDLSLGYAYNLYGTDTGHLMLGYRFTRPEFRRARARNEATATPPTSSRSHTSGVRSRGHR
ncbi:MAG: hypothetical protein ACRD2Z_17295 [Thermoanaerobaculia bacterium]